jgi:hypothetical protein
MKTTPSPSDAPVQATNDLPRDSEWENDAIWNLLRTAPPIRASHGFADRVMAGIHATEEQSPSFWSQCRRYILPAIAAAACVVGAIVSSLPQEQGKSIVVDASAEVSATESFAELQEATNREVLLAAADHLNDFSDTELVSLIGL